MVVWVTVDEVADVMAHADFPSDVTAILRRDGHQIDYEKAYSAGYYSHEVDSFLRLIGMVTDVDLTN